MLTLLSVSSVFILYLIGGAQNGPRRFQVLAVVTLAVGSACSIFFLAGTHERIPRPRRLSMEDSSTPASINNGVNGPPVKRTTRFHWYSWFSVLDFYLVAAIYMSARITVNISQVYL